MALFRRVKLFKTLLSQSLTFIPRCKQLNYALNSLLSLNMVVALLVAFALDNTVPGSKEERGVYIWSDSSSVDSDPAALVLYMLPKRIGSYFRWAKCVGS